MKKKIAKLFVQPSQLTASIPHAVFCNAVEKTNKLTEILAEALKMPIGDIEEAKAAAGHHCDTAPPEDVENQVLNPNYLASFRCKIHPKGVKGVYVIEFALSCGSDTQWFYTEKSAFEKDQAFFEELVGTVDTFNS